MPTSRERLDEYIDLIGIRPAVERALHLRAVVLEAEQALAELRHEADAAAVALLGDRNQGLNQSEMSELFGYSRANAGRVVKRHKERTDA